MLLQGSIDVSVYAAAVHPAIADRFLADIFVVAGVLSLTRRLKMVPTVG